MPAQLIHRGRLSYDNPASRHKLPAFCDWLLWRLDDGSSGASPTGELPVYISLALDHKDNPGPSVTNAAESIAEHAYRQIKNTRHVKPRDMLVEKFLRQRGWVVGEGSLGTWRPTAAVCESCPHFFTCALEGICATP